MLSALGLAVLSGWTLWHDVAIYEAAAHTRLGGTTYAVDTYATDGACQVGQREARANEERPRSGPLTQRLPSGVVVWDGTLQHYTTFLYRCSPAGTEIRGAPARP
jgi:hypothetical protein